MVDSGMDAEALAERRGDVSEWQLTTGSSAHLVLRGPVMPDLIRDELLSEIFGATAARQPQARCMVEGDRVFTYQQVDEQATALARGLLREGIRPGMVVGLWMP